MNEANTDSTRRINVDAQLNTAPFNFVRSGYYLNSDGKIYSNQGDYGVGLYWSSRSGGNTHAIYLYFFSTYLYPRNSFPKGYGHSIRCLGR